MVTSRAHIEVDKERAVRAKTVVQERFEVELENTIEGCRTSDGPFEVCITHDAAGLEDLIRTHVKITYWRLKLHRHGWTDMVKVWTSSPATLLLQEESHQHRIIIFREILDGRLIDDLSFGVLPPWRWRRYGLSNEEIVRLDL